MKGKVELGETIFLPSNVILDASGALIRRANNANTAMFRIENASNITIRGFFDGNKDNNPTSTDDVSDFILTNSSNVTFERVYLKNSEYWGIGICDNCSNVRVLNSTIENPRSTAVVIWPSSESNPASNVYVCGCTLKDSEAHGFNCRWASSVHIEGNTCLGNAFEGIYVEGGLTNVVIKQNIVDASNSIYYAIGVANSHRVVVEGNVTYNPLWANIYVNGEWIVVANNICLRPDREQTGSWDGIRYDAMKGVIQGNVVHELYGARYGIWLEGGSQVSVIGNYVDAYGGSKAIYNNVSDAVIALNWTYGGITDTTGSAYVYKNRGWLTENSGIVTITGDGSTREFNVTTPHNLVSDKASVSVSTTKPTTATPSYIFAYLDDYNNDDFRETIVIDVQFDSAPADGEVIELYWKAEVVA